MFVEATSWEEAHLVRREHLCLVKRTKRQDLVGIIEVSGGHMPCLLLPLSSEKDNLGGRLADHNRAALNDVGTPELDYRSISHAMGLNFDTTYVDESRRLRCSTMGGDIYSLGTSRCILVTRWAGHGDWENVPDFVGSLTKAIGFLGVVPAKEVSSEDASQLSPLTDKAVWE